MVKTLYAARRLLEEGRPAALATVIEGPEAGRRALFDGEGLVEGELPEDIAAEVAAAAVELLVHGRSCSVSCGGSRVFVDVLEPRPRLVVVGAGHAGEVLAAMAGLAGFDVVVCDPRAAFAVPDRFPAVAQIIVGWPHEVIGELNLDGRTSVVILSHDAKIEDPLLPLLLDSPVGYIGVMGSRRTHAGRLERLRASGCEDDELARIRGPVGLDIGAGTPEEMAVAILGEVILARSATGTGLPLCGLAGSGGSVTAC
jgi:xanthine dehydrogenase accessory factor